MAARLDIGHLQRLRDATGIPLVLHGGSGVQRSYLLEAIRTGLTKINIGTEIRQAFEREMRSSNDLSRAQEACYERTRQLLNDHLGLAGTRQRVLGRVDEG